MPDWESLQNRITGYEEIELNLTTTSYIFLSNLPMLQKGQ